MTTAEPIRLPREQQTAKRLVPAPIPCSGQQMGDSIVPPIQAAHSRESSGSKERAVSDESSCAANQLSFDQERHTMVNKGGTQYRPWLDVAPPSDYLRNIADSATGKGYKSFAKALLNINQGSVVVDLGCGAGLDLPACAEAAGRTGKVIGIDFDQALLAHAGEYTSHLPTVSVTNADIHQLPLKSGTVDRVHIDRVLQHVDSPATVLAEAARTLRRDGMIVCIEPDWATLAIDHPDVGFSCTYTRHVVDQVIRNATIGRALPRMLGEAGLSVDAVYPVTAQWTDAIEGDRVLGFRDVCKHAVANGVLPAATTQSWIDDLMTGPFFSALSLFIVVAHVEGT